MRSNSQDIVNPTHTSTVGETWEGMVDVKSYPLKVHDKVDLMAYQTVLPTKTVYVGLTVSTDKTTTSEVGQEVYNTITAYSEGGRLNMFQLGSPKNTLDRFRTTLDLMNDGDAIIVMAEKDGLSEPIVEALNIQQVPADLPNKYSLAEDSSLVQAIIKELPDGEKANRRGELASRLFRMIRASS